MPIHRLFFLKSNFLKSNFLKSNFLRPGPAFYWGALFVLIALAWVVLWFQVPSVGGGASWGAAHGLFSWAAHGSSSLASLTAMWALMTVAMMLPTFVPMASVFGDLTYDQRHRLSMRLGFSFGYIVVWLGFSGIAALMQHGLTRLGFLDAAGIVLVPSLTFFLLLAAGLYQFSPLKAACVRQCQMPLTFLITHWRDGVWGPFGMGLHHGVICLGCCWALMALAFVGGTMNLIWMGLATALMMLEKLPLLGQRLTSALGIILCAFALAYGVARLMQSALFPGGFLWSGT